MLIGKDCVVTINYILKNDSGEVLDESPEGQPMAYLHGASGIIPGLEDELTGKTAGTEFSVTIESEDGYGDRVPGLIQEVPIASFPTEPALEMGMQFTAETENGPMSVMITALNGDTVTVDGNHPLAGMTLHFSGSIADVRMATAEELEHGHAH